MTNYNDKNLFKLHLLINSEAEEYLCNFFAATFTLQILILVVLIHSTVFEDQLGSHLKKCNQTKKTQVVSKKNYGLTENMHIFMTYIHTVLISLQV